MFMKIEVEQLLFAGIFVNILLFLIGCVLTHFLLKYKRLSDMDVFTGVLNRLAIEKYINRNIDHNEEDNYALFVIDIDNFKRINDIFGHPFGDKVIKDVSDIMKRKKKENTLVGRLGGDEFAVFIRKFGCIDEVLEYATVLYKSMHIPYAEKEEEYIVSVSIGIGIYKKGMRFQDLYTMADRSLYQAKYSGRDCVSFN